ncbi:MULTISPECIES: polyhydroxyalkanoate synthesis repressor PhaR [Caldimonas]|jgi:polyhydroxyalkanoate synthesis repressor PhaR|uniref:polyhydroxyalkanoate synthesis repressor PhaR n=1 Tax=Caldimonas TaxID=196013 RepID=UPI00037F9C84|nr:MULTISPECIES: polyhydroxyalkanoate synthesis repressor PhaR [Caldimonas]MCX7659099.1 polyhydroxyalkanoate synthesis repressor PhaR [Caldimonas manganoxidans]GIX25272.1 MAG: polyhydroxyalkanoate synthesis repressor PhaR [Caldimonas sp.]
MAQAKRGASPSASGGAAPQLRTLKKYPNRRLYDTATSSYITLADVKKMVLAGEDFIVRDAKTNEDLTRSILLQIILEEESGGVPMFSTHMLADIIRVYGNAMQGMMGAYLEKSIEAFVNMQKRFAEQSRGMVEGKGFSPEMWTQFMSVQAPMVQGLMNSYLEQSKTLFEQLQAQMQKQAETLMPPGFPGFGPPKR